MGDAGQPQVAMYVLGQQIVIERKLIEIQCHGSSSTQVSLHQLRDVDNRVVLEFHRQTRIVRSRGTPIPWSRPSTTCEV
jgi:hypothetical protein